MKQILPGISIEKEFDEIARKLELVGLTPYESRAYVALVAHGYGDANTIAQTAQIPRTSSYKVLQSLKDKGFAIATSGRPVIYRPEPPKRIHTRLEREVFQMFEQLELMHEIVRERGQPQLIYTIHEKSRVLEKIGELIDKSTETLMIATPVLHELLRDPLGKKMENALNRSIRLTIITAPNQRVPVGAIVHRRRGLLTTDIISDRHSALIAGTELEACGYTDNELLASHLERFLNVLADTEERAVKER